MLACLKTVKCCEILHENKDSKTAIFPFRFDVQQVYHTQNEEFTDFRGYAGRIVSGSLSTGDRIKTLPSGQESVVTEIRRYKDTVDRAEAGTSVVLSLADEIDISRGAVISLADNSDLIERKELSATVVWMDEKVATVDAKYILKTGARESLLKLQEIKNVVNPLEANQNTEASEIRLNDIARVGLKLSQGVYMDSYRDNKKNGVFILIDPQSNATIAVGFVD